MLNHIVTMGRLTACPTLRHTQSGIPVCSFTIACDRDYKNANGERKADFLDVVAWRQTAEFVSRYFSKGQMAVIDGRLQLRDWTDRNGGRRRSAEILASSVNFGDSKPRQQNQSSPAPSYASAAAQPGGFEDMADGGELPF